MSKISFAIDRGGTFTDIYACDENGKVMVLKLLSKDPNNYEDAPREGIRRLLQRLTGNNYPQSEPLDTSQIQWIRMGTTVATNALLERKGEKIAVAITKGFKDLLYIGNQARPKLFDLEVKYPSVLYENVIEVEERIVLKQDVEDNFQGEKVPTVIGNTGEEVEIWETINKEKLMVDLKKVLEEGIKSLAVVLIHSYIYPHHEIEVGRLAKSLGFTHVSLSSIVMPMVKAVPRGFTACADAYLTPCIKKYLRSFFSGFKNNLKGINVLFMQSDGGLTTTNNFLGSRAILSGPAGGVVGYAKTTYERETNLPVIGFDMGGTSTDVSRYNGELEHIFESTTSGVTIQAPQLDINTVAAGGGSKLFYRSGLFVVGPESAGAHPGPVCYRKGGPLTVTDANLCLGRLLPEYFPKIFGETEDQPLDKDSCLKEFEKLTKIVNNFDSNKRTRSVEEIALGFLEVANEAMCRPIRALTQGKGYDTSKHVLACFGGAGGQHACAIARSLGMSTVFIHRYAGILSAFGMALADVVQEAQEPCALIYQKESFSLIEDKIKSLEDKCRDELKKGGFTNKNIETESFLHMRYEKTDCSIMCSSKGFPATKNSCQNGDFLQAFLDRYSREFGFTVENRNVLVDDIRVRGIGKTNIKLDNPIEKCSGPPEVEKVVKCYFENGYEDTGIYFLAKLKAGHSIEGPAIIIDDLCTVLVEPNCKANVTKNGDIKIEIGSIKPRTISSQLDSIQLSIFSHRFMSIAEQMGRILQRTAISTNIKERLDFSCALFGPNGGLVSNAPHIPVHLGAMQEAVQFQLRYLGNDLHEGDVLLSNHPCAGGSHLPDLTVITPVFYRGQPKPVFFVASRGHHADIGGITPGSMPPHSTTLSQEGATFISFKIVNRGVFQEAELVELLNAPAKLPGSSGTRNLSDNLSDLKAQIAANHKGIFLVSELIDQYSLNVVQSYMEHIQTNAEVSVRDMLKEIASKVEVSANDVELMAEDCMDDGTLIKLKITINKKEGSAVFDFNGTGIEVYNNWNTPKAVTLSAIIYCLRCMVGHEVPLNQGCLAPIKIILPKGIVLNPSDEAAVVGGNVLTSQRVVDVILKAFQVCAASQGCMNNITFGDENIGYYETIGGGAGAGPNWHGRSGTHSHMTNTRITDPEILERRYPVILKKFHLRKGSGGEGKYKGGDGIVREMLFRKSLVLSILTERRVFSPYGLNGGKDGLKGLNLFTYKNWRTVNLGGKTSIIVNPGDIFHLESPGGGGYGQPIENHSEAENILEPSFSFENRGSIFEYQRAQESV